MNLRPARVHDGRLDLAGATVGLPPEAVPLVQEGQDVIWGARPEYLGWSTSTTDAADAIPGIVSILEPLGAAVLVTVDAGTETLQLVVDDEAAPSVGDTGSVVVSPRRTLVFDADGELIEPEPAAEPAPAAVG
jgi:multiple sugar transport system ATP-binding protein